MNVKKIGRGKYHNVIVYGFWDPSNSNLEATSLNFLKMEYERMSQNKNNSLFFTIIIDEILKTFRN